jgi:HK97 family phage prohead protease
MTTTADVLRGAQELRAEGDGMPTLVGHFAVFDQWAEIDSMHEGHFMERVSPGSMERTLREDKPKVLFQHGRDPSIGDKPLGVPKVLREDQVGAYYEVPMLNTNYNAEIVPGLRAGAYGASFRFSVEGESRVERPERSAYNPNGIPERTIEQAKVLELSVVTFPAYSGATAGVRSLTDWYRSGAVGTRAVIWTPALRREVLLAI